MNYLFVLITILTSISAIAGLKEDITYLASDKMKGRVPGSAENSEVQTWLIDRLMSLKVRPAGNLEKKLFIYPFENSYDFKSQQKIRGTNIIGILYPRNQWSDEQPKVLIGAHFDHINKCWKKFDETDEICNGAADNAAAVAVVLNVAQNLANQIHAPVALAFWDGEEGGLLGSDSFVQNPSFNIKQLVAYINLDIIGLNLAVGLENHHMIIGSETGGATFEKIVRETVPSNEKITYNQLSYAFGHGRSDMTSFIRHGYEIPFVFFSDGDGPVYHSSSDEVTKINFEKVTSIVQMVEKLATRLTKMNKIDLPFAKPTVYIDKGSFFQNLITKIFGRDHALRVGFPVPKFSDIEVVLRIYDITLKHAQKNQLKPETITKLNELRQALKKIQSNGERNFSGMDYYKVLQAGGTLTFILRDLPFIP